ncbi:hypothetical protein FB561_4636 [Kribbella amoyensis]|uniref:Uncharacterized protein n=1 Tax=Kribbella amoyensis TaxID=996641 RepID=A0A561BX97_9ACTN|nr:hypothetical protein FB561_4636 [Kribbella amoyensis]
MRWTVTSVDIEGGVGMQVHDDLLYPCPSNPFATVCADAGGKRQAYCGWEIFTGVDRGGAVGYSAVSNVGSVTVAISWARVTLGASTGFSVDGSRPAKVPGSARRASPSTVATASWPSGRT